MLASVGVRLYQVCACCAVCAAGRSLRRPVAAPAGRTAHPGRGRARGRSRHAAPPRRPGTLILYKSRAFISAPTRDVADADAPDPRGITLGSRAIADIASRTHCPGAVAGARGSETAARAPKLSLVSRLRHRRTLGDESTESSTGPIEPVTADSPAPHAPIRDTTRYKTHRRPRTVAYALLHAGFPHAAQSHPPNVHCRRPTGAGAEPKPPRLRGPPRPSSSFRLIPPHARTYTMHR